MIQYNDPDLLDLKDLSISLNILNFGQNGEKEGDSTVPVTDKPTCKNDTCCYKPTGSCPDGYQYASGGDVIQYNDPDLVDLKGLSVSLDILNFFKDSKSSTSTPASNKPKCESNACCYKPVESVEGGKCPDGYSHASQGDVIQTNDPDLVDAKGLSVILNILNFGQDNTKTGSKSVSASDKPTCDSNSCCYKTTTSSSCPAGYTHVKQGDVIQTNDPDLIDLKDLSISLNILNFGSNGKQTGSSTKPASDKTTCDSASCCVKTTKPSKGSNGNKGTCPSGYKQVSQGDKIQTNDPDLVDLKDLSISLNILNFGSSGKQEDEKTVAASSNPTCQSSTCCVKASKKEQKSTKSQNNDSSDKSTKKTCPSGYSTASRGDVMQVNDPDLVDLKDVKISIHILDFSKPDKQKTVDASQNPTCDDDTCCYKPSVKQTNDPDLVDAKGAEVNVCLLSSNCSKK